jgi:hypothetical protein
VHDNVDIDDKEYALQQVLGITKLSFRFNGQYIKVEVDSIVNQPFSFTTMRFY